MGCQGSLQESGHIAHKRVAPTPSDPVYLAALSQAFPYQGEILHTEHRGITLAQLRSVLTFVADSCTGWVDTAPPDISRTSGQTISIEWASLYEVNTWVIRPATFNDKCAFVELMSAEPQIATWFVSHWWGEPIWEFFACVVNHCATRNAGELEALVDKATYWVCAYANRQHSLGQELTMDPRETSFFKAILLSEGILLILDGAKEHSGPATPFQRIWCDFEESLAVDRVLDIATFRFFQESDIALPDPLEPVKCMRENCKFLQDPATGDGYCCLPCLSEHPCGHDPNCLREPGMEPINQAPLLDVVQQPDIRRLALKGKAELLTDGILPIDGNRFPLLRKARREGTFPMDLFKVALSVKIQRGMASVAEDRAHILNSISGRSLELPPLEEHEAYEVVNKKLHAKFALAALPSAALLGILDELPIFDQIRGDQSMTELALVMNMCPNLTDVKLLSSAFSGRQNLKSLKLQLEKCQTLSDIDYLSKALPTLPFVHQLDINLSHCELLLDVAPVGAGIAAMPSLKRLAIDLDSCNGLQSLESFFAGLAQGCGLQYLFINCNCCRQLVSIVGFGKALLACSQLTDVFLSFGGCNYLVGLMEELEYGLPGLHALKHLSLRLNFTTGTVNLDTLGRACFGVRSSLHHLEVFLIGCPNITGEEALAAHLRSLTLITFNWFTSDQKYDFVFSSAARYVGWVARDSSDRCVLQHASKLLTSDETVPLTLSSHSGFALAEGPKWEGKGCHALLLGTASEALLACHAGEVLRVYLKSLDNERCIDYVANTWKRIGIFHAGPSLDRSQILIVNDDGTISPLMDNSQVLGVGYKPHSLSL